MNMYFLYYLYSFQNFKKQTTTYFQTIKRSNWFDIRKVYVYK